MNTEAKVPDHIQRAFSSTGYSDEIYDLTGIMEDPLRNQNLITGERYFCVNENNKVRSYLMPGPLSTIRQMKDYIREQFPIEDKPEIFGLHQSATRKANTEVAADIMHRTYIYQFVIKKKP